jgi:nucleotide-binding universal stress UspA family protein
MPTRQIQEWASPRRILLATDLIDLKSTLPLAIQQAQAYKAELQIVHVLPDPNISVIDPVLLVYADPDRLRNEAGAALSKAASVATAAAIRCVFRIPAGDPPTEIIRLAGEWKADRLVAGSHGKEKFHLHILGSVAESLFHHIDIPVLAIGSQVPVTNRVNRRMHILFATALDHDAQRMAEFAIRVAEKHRADITFLHVSPEIPQAHPSATRVTDCAESLLRQLLIPGLIKNCKPNSAIVWGQVSDGILQYAREHSADMIILGASAHSAFNPRFIPGTAHRVLCDSLCPVLVLKQESPWVISPKSQHISRLSNCSV